MKKTLTVLTVLALAFAMVGSASADMVSYTGDVDYSASIPTDLRLDKYESDDDIFVFDEKQNLTLASALSVDIAKPGTYNDAGDLVGAGGVIPAGTIVNSYIVHVDPKGTPSGLVTYQGSITLSEKILGLIVNTSGLNSTDSVLGALGTTYDSSTMRGLEFTNQDQVTLWVSPDGMGMTLKASNVLDNIRVVELVPVPGAVVLGLLGLGVAGLKLRKFA